MNVRAVHQESITTVCRTTRQHYKHWCSSMTAYEYKDTWMNASSRTLDTVLVLQ